MELYLQSFFGLHVHSFYSLRRPRNPPPHPPRHLGSYTRALLVSQDRRHLSVTPCIDITAGHVHCSVCIRFYCTRAVFLHQWVKDTFSCPLFRTSGEKKAFRKETFQPPFCQCSRILPRERLTVCGLHLLMVKTNHPNS
jgi:hypothetical protein